MEYPKCCGLADPSTAEVLFAGLEPIDGLSHYSCKMWDKLTGIILQEWFGFRLPPSKLPWDGPILLPSHLRLVYCLNRSYARQALIDIRKHYLELNRASPTMSIFSAHGDSIPDDLQREREGLEFFVRQASHFRSLDDYLFIVQSIYADG